MSTQVKELSQEQMHESLKNLLINDYIEKSSLDSEETITIEEIEEKLDFNISQNDLDEVKLSIHTLIENEINSQTEDGSPESRYLGNDVSDAISSFDFSKYKNMNIEELRSYLWVWDEESGKDIVGDNLIQDKIERACVGIYSLLKGGTFIHEDKSKIISDVIVNKIKELKEIGGLSEEHKAKIIASLN